ncbi:hypothetical protein EG327_005899 [Venturia inaequalis]|uniref:RING-type domain-containing protein n=1 Tax=Venturia inaequalis TaxID=5025 RepID=A0A8H3V710_VENIN|nr:hypothetical protein EG327_005899 [Venturia inaequalis]
MAEGHDTGQRDLEKELTCSICKEVLFQPLTLLDCLHSFCGGCLKEWFAHQASVARSIHPYTCPSCRASVRVTRPNATVTTLLESFLRENPSKDRSEEDKQDERDKYKPGDTIMPRLRLRGAPRSEEDQRLMDEVMALSMDEAGIGGNSNTLREPENGRTRHRSRENRSRGPSRSPGQARVERHDNNTRVTRPRGSRGPSRDPSPQRERARQLEHQHSLRSILSVSELDPQEMQEDIMRQIAEEGLLNDIDWNNLDTTQEEELSEMIARAYQQRREQRRQERRQRDRGTGSTRDRSRDRSAQNSPRQQPTTENTSSRHAESAIEDDTASRAPARPPVSNPHLIDSANLVHTARHRRTGSGTSTRSTTRSDSANAASSSSNGLGTEGVAAASRPEARRRMSNERRSTDPERTRTLAHRPHTQSNPSAPAGSPPNSLRELQVEGASHRRQRSGSNPRPHRSPLLASSTFPQTRPNNNSSPSLVPSQTPATPAAASSYVTTPLPTTPVPTRNALAPAPADGRPTSSSSGNHRPTLYTEPSVSCDRCGKSHIEYDLYYSCKTCQNGKFNICLLCYRAGKGCLHWYGFGRASRAKYERLAPPGGYSPDQEPPHELDGHRYLRPQHSLVPAPSTTPDQPKRSVTQEDPAKRLQDGVFCDICTAFANPCYWKCDICNEGGWGYCNDCVNQGRHCTHPLLPLKAISNDTKWDPSNGLNASHSEADPPLTPKSASIVKGLGTVTIANRYFKLLQFLTKCDICTYSISPSNTRFHCPVCNDGDYDICSPCYHGQISMGKISAANGPNGWRRCPQGHRMVVIGFEDRDGGQRRLVERDRVGGSRLKEESSGSNDMTAIPDWSWKDANGKDRKARTGYNVSGRLPPDGGVGLRLVANWGYFPGEGVKDELMFPKGAEIREAEDINGDWFWGGYAGAMGLFPGNYGRIVGGFGGEVG